MFTASIGTVLLQSHDGAIFQGDAHNRPQETAGMIRCTQENGMAIDVARPRRSRPARRPSAIGLASQGHCQGEATNPKPVIAWPEAAQASP